MEVEEGFLEGGGEVDEVGGGVDGADEGVGVEVGGEVGGGELGDGDVG